MKKIYIHGSYYGNNFGDVLLVDIFAQKIRSKGYEPIFPFANSFYSKQTGVEVGIQKKEDILCGLFCGGGYFGEHSNGKFMWSIRNTFRHGKAFLLYKLLSVQYGLFGVGIGPLTYNPFKYIVEKIINQSKSVVVRDQESKKYIEQYTNYRDTKVLADVVISLNKNDIPQVHSIENNNRFKQIFASEKVIIGIHITNQYKNNNTFNYIKDAIKKLSKNNNIYFIFISDGTSRLGKKLQQTIDAENIAFELESDNYSFYRYENHWNMCSLLSKLDLVITSKLHVGIVSTALKTSVVSIPYHQKTIRYYKQIKAEDRCLLKIDSDEDIYNHIKKYIDSPPIDVPKNVIDSSRNVFDEMYKFIDKVSYNA